MMPSGIPGLRPRQHPAVCVTVGTKGKNGAPTDKERLYIKAADGDQVKFATKDGREYDALAKPEHPLFGEWHAGRVGSRVSIPIKLAHLAQGDAFKYHYKGAPEMPGIPRHPRRGPGCYGNGQVAFRWDGKNYATCRCPAEQCQYRQGEKPPCKPFMWLGGRLAIPGLPSLSFEFRSYSIHTIANVAGFFAQFAEACVGMSVDPARVPLWGLPGSLNLTQVTRPGKRFPVVRLELGGTDLFAWIESQLKRADEMRTLAAAQPLLVPLPDEEQEAAGAAARVDVGRVA